MITELLAPGAPPRAGTVPLFVPCLEGREREYVRECFETGWVSSAGPFVDRFEAIVAEAVGARHAVATSSGTAALHLALLVAGVGRDDVVLVPSLTFVAPANAVRYVGARPLFIDAEPRFWQMDVEQTLHRLGAAVRRAGGLVDRESGRRIGAVLPVHALGHPVDLDPLLERCRALAVPVVEDAAESLGASYRGRAVGRSGDVACFSFNGNKLVTTGGGGMLVTDRADWASRARYLSTQAKDDALEYVHGAVGYNYRLSNLLAAVGVAQMERLAPLVEAKRAVARRYAEGLGGVPGLTLMDEAPWARSTYWMYTVLVDEAVFGMSARALLRRLAHAGIQTRPLWQPLHLSPAHGPEPGRCPVAESLHRRALTLPCSAGLTAAEQDRVVEAVRAAAASAEGAA
jgi:perosamine synthetase